MNGRSTNHRSAHMWEQHALVCPACRELRRKRRFKRSDRAQALQMADVMSQGIVRQFSAALAV